MLRFVPLCIILLAMAQPAPAADPVAKVAKDVNEKMVKIFGSGGFRGVVNYSSGLLISPDGFILTVASQTLDTSELIVHLYDGRKVKAVVVTTEPELDVALLKIKIEGKKLDEPSGLDLPCFDFAASLKRPPAEAGDWVLGFSNQFEIATRNEPMSVQQGAVTSFAKLHGRRGIFDFPYTGDVYVVDAITNNPGAGGGALTDRNGQLLGIIGREIKNSLSETWINYAIPLSAKTEVKLEGEKTQTLALSEFVSLGMQFKYKPIIKPIVALGAGGYHGIKFVPNILERTPPYVDDFYPSSPAAKAGVQINDLVSFIDGEPIYSIKAFNDYMRKTRPGTSIRLEVRRGDNLQTVEVKLDEWPKGLLPAIPIPKTIVPPK